MQHVKKWKITIFRDELFGGSSYFNGMICSKMKRLSVVDAFCTVFNAIGHLVTSLAKFEF